MFSIAVDLLDMLLLFAFNITCLLINTNMHSLYSVYLY